MTSTRKRVLPRCAGAAPCMLALGASLAGFAARAADAGQAMPSSAPPAAETAPAPAPSDSGSGAIDWNEVRVGYYFVHYSASANDLSGPFTPPGINIEVQHVNTPYFAYLRRLTEHWQLELAGGVPPTTHTVATGPATVGSVPLNGEVVATARWFSPSVLLEYNFFPEHDPLRPFVGAGFNYTKFYERNSTAAGDAVNGGPTSTSLSDSFGPAATAGLTYRFLQHFTLTGSFSIATVKSNYVSDTSGIYRTTTVNFHPTTWVLSVGYKF